MVTAEYRNNNQHAFSLQQQQHRGFHYRHRARRGIVNYSIIPNKIQSFYLFSAIQPYCMNLAKKTRGMIGHKERQRNGIVFRLHRTLGSVTVTVCKTGLLHGSRKTLSMGRLQIVILRHTVSLCVLKNGKKLVKKSYFCCH